MLLPKMILVPTDFGDPSAAALDYAIGLAGALGAEIVLLHSYELPIIGMPDGTMVATAELASRILEGAKVGLDKEVARRKDAGASIRAIIKQGDACQMINETADEVKAGLIVMGTHGRRGLPRALIGSVAEKVVRTAHVPVLTIHAGGVMRGEEMAAESRKPAPAPVPINGFAPTHR